jgi:tetratricopeptide (TPR) repeat protein
MNPQFEQLLSALQNASPDTLRQIFTEMALTCDPVSNSREYELLCTRIATQAQNIIPFCVGIVSDVQQDTNIRVAAAVIGAIACRRNRRRADGQQILRHVEHLESDFPILLHMRALTYRYGEPADLRRGRRLAENAYARLPNNPGVIHSLAAFLIDLAYIEEDDDTERKLLLRALPLVNDAIEKESRSSFYYTRARINRKLGNYSDAKDDLGIAIDLEDPSAADYRDRIGEYLVQSSLVDVDRSTRQLLRNTKAELDRSETRIAELEERVEEANRRSNAAQLQTVSVLAFFSSILALIQFTALTLGKGYSLQQALVLVAVVGVILFVAVVLGSWLLRQSVPKSATNRSKLPGR